MTTPKLRCADTSVRMSPNRLPWWTGARSFGTAVWLSVHRRSFLGQHDAVVNRHRTTFQRYSLIEDVACINTDDDGDGG